MEEERTVCQYCPYIKQTMVEQMGKSTAYSIERDEKYIPAVSYGHGSVYSDFWYGDGPYPNYYAGAYPFPYANYPYYPLPPKYPKR